MLHACGWRRLCSQMVVWSVDWDYGVYMGINWRPATKSAARAYVATHARHDKALICSWHSTQDAMAEIHLSCSLISWISHLLRVWRTNALKPNVHSKDVSGWVGSEVTGGGAIRKGKHVHVIYLSWEEHWAGSQGAERSLASRALWLDCPVSYFGRPRRDRGVLLSFKQPL